MKPSAIPAFPQFREVFADKPFRNNTLRLILLDGML
jgi:hypothetical protein